MRSVIFAALGLTAIVAFASDADAQWYRRNTRQSYNSYSRPQNQFHYFPEHNQLVHQYNYSNDISIYSSGPLVQFGSPEPVYVPRQRPLNTPSWARW